MPQGSLLSCYYCNLFPWNAKNDISFNRPSLLIILRLTWSSHSKSFNDLFPHTNCILCTDKVLLFGIVGSSEGTQFALLNKNQVNWVSNITTRSLEISVLTWLSSRRSLKNWYTCAVKGAYRRIANEYRKLLLVGLWSTLSSAPIVIMPLRRLVWHSNPSSSARSTTRWQSEDVMSSTRFNNTQSPHLCIHWLFFYFLCIRRLKSRI